MRLTDEDYSFPCFGKAFAHHPGQKGIANKRIASLADRILQEMKAVFEERTKGFAGPI